MVDEGFYYFETFTSDVARYFKVDKVYYQGKTKYQFAQLFYNKVFGKVLFLDNKIQSAQIDEFIFHEALVHPALFTHDSPQEVLLIGGGEGATLREILKHAPVSKAVMVDIDRELVELCQEYLPEWSDGSFSHPKTKLIFGDARKYLKKVEQKFDVIISDLTEPVSAGPSIYLFTREFFELVFQGLKEEGIFVLQAGSADPYYYHFFASCAKTLKSIFPVVRPYRAFVFSFSLPWGFIIASKKNDPLGLAERELAKRMHSRGVGNLRFYHPTFHRSLFSFPAYLVSSLKKGKMLTDKKPFIWEA